MEPTSLALCRAIPQKATDWDPLMAWRIVQQVVFLKHCALLSSSRVYA